MYEDQLVNVPRYFQQFKDFPQPAEMPMFPHRSEWAQYLRRYADHFDLARYVRFSKYVKSVRRSANVPASSLPHGRRPGRFCVAVVDAQSSLHRKAQAKWSFFDWVICANGHNSKVREAPAGSRFLGRGRMGEWGGRARDVVGGCAGAGVVEHKLYCSESVKRVRRLGTWSLQCTK